MIGIKAVAPSFWWRTLSSSLQAVARRGSRTASIRIFCPDFVHQHSISEHGTPRFCTEKQDCVAFLKVGLKAKKPHPKGCPDELKTITLK
jgi:hypothetical protein